MSTKVYGASDDLIEFDGDVYGEVGCYGTDEDDSPGVLLIFSDGTLLVAKYGKNGQGIWGITLLKRGALFDRIDQGSDEADVSDFAHFKDGLTWAYAAKEHWEVVR